MMNQLENLKQFTTIVADSGDVETIKKYSPQDATTNPSIILQVARLKHYKELFENAINYAKKKGGNKKTKINNAVDKLSVNIGHEILKKIPGRISTEIDAKLSFNKIKSIKQAKKIINLYKEQGIDKSRILIKLAATWEGIKAAEELEKIGIKCNLTLIFSFAQARACAEAKVHLISPFIGRIYDWHHNKQPIIPYTTKNDPGIQSIIKIFNYYKKHNYSTIVMGASFRKKEQIIALAGCDYLTISSTLLKELKENITPIKIKLLHPKKTIEKPKKILSESEFRWEHNQNEMAVEKLAEGIRKFAIDQQCLENIISNSI